MLPIDWQFWGIFSVPLILIASAAIGFKYAGRVRVGILRWSLRSLCVPLGLIGSLAAMLLVAGRGCASYSPLIYSPTGTFAARIELDDYGATGGDESVDLFFPGVSLPPPYGDGKLSSIKHPTPRQHILEEKIPDRKPGLDLGRRIDPR